jgi:tetratricopeptide (TPR) repeat protein
MSIIDSNSDIFNLQPYNLSIIRRGANLGYCIGQVDKSIELFRKLAPLSNLATDYFQLAEILSHKNLVSESLKALKKAMILDPLAYDNETNQETIQFEELNSRLENTLDKVSKKKIGRYPSTEEFKGDFKILVKDHIANNLQIEKKFIDRGTKFFTMGSCFARNISKTLNDQGFDSKHLEISEFLNTTFANKAFVNWLSNSSNDIGLNERFKDLLSQEWSKKDTIKTIRDTDVFVITLGVAFAFLIKKMESLLCLAHHQSIRECWLIGVFIE